MNKHDDIITLYGAGRWIEVLALLEHNIQSFLDEGNEVQSARSLSYLGIIHLYFANYHQVSTIYKQIHDEYSREPVDVRVRAHYARFLAMYYTWLGDNTQAHHLFQISLSLFEETDLQEDETIALLEYIYWFCLLFEEWVPLLKSLERLKQLTVKQSKQLQEEIAIAQQCMEWRQGKKAAQAQKAVLIKKEGGFVISRLFHFAIQTYHVLMSNNFVQTKQIKDTISDWRSHEKHFSTCVLKEFISGLITLLQLHIEKKDELIPKHMQHIIAKLELFRHPWFRKMLHSVQMLSSQIKEQQSNPPSYRFTITLFDTFAIHCGDVSVSGDSWGTKQERELFLYILLKADGKASKDVVLEEFFSGIDVKKSSNRLYVTVHRINRSIQKVFRLPQGLSLIQIQQGSIVISQDLLEEIDVHTYLKLISVATQLWNHDRKTSVELVNKAKKLFSPHFLNNVLYVDWVSQFREDLMNRHDKAMRKLARHYYDQGENGMYEELMTELIELQPIHEELYLEYIQYLLAANKQTEASHWYRKLEHKLDIELGLSPSFMLHELKGKGKNSDRGHRG